MSGARVRDDDEDCATVRRHDVVDRFSRRIDRADGVERARVAHATLHASGAVEQRDGLDPGVADLRAEQGRQVVVGTARARLGNLAGDRASQRSGGRLP